VQAADEAVPRAGTAPDPSAHGFDAALARLREAMETASQAYAQRQPATFVETTSRTASCRACGRSRWWRSIHGVVVCAVCHPPATVDLVAAWLPAPVEHDA
jgi:hypothetical protein